jgi:hypothetical protein
MFTLCKAGGLPDEKGGASGRARKEKRRRQATAMSGGH